jgi:hypothetical protein
MIRKVTNLWFLQEHNELTLHCAGPNGTQLGQANIGNVATSITSPSMQSSLANAYYPVAPTKAYVAGAPPAYAAIVASAPNAGDSNISPMQVLAYPIPQAFPVPQRQGMAGDADAGLHGRGGPGLAAATLKGGRAHES